MTKSKQDLTMPLPEKSTPLRFSPKGGGVFVP